MAARVFSSSPAGGNGSFRVDWAWKQVLQTSMTSTRASIHFFLVKSIERLVELCGRRDAALKKRCQETLGERVFERGALFFSASSKRSGPARASRPVEQSQRAALAAPWLVRRPICRNRRAVFLLVFSADMSLSRHHQGSGAGHSSTVSVLCAVTLMLVFLFSFVAGTIPKRSKIFSGSRTSS